MKKRILVTGGAGAIGSCLVNELSSDPENELVVIDNLSSGHVENIAMRPNVRFIHGAVESDEDLGRAFENSLDVIFHLAANFANQNSVDFPQRDLVVNGLGTLKVLVKAAEHNVPRLVYSSSSCVYGYRDEFLDEECKLFSLETPYAITKLLGEQYVEFLAHHNGLKAVVLRYFNVFGPCEYPGKYRNVIANFFFKAMHGEDLVITGTGEETRDFSYVDDAVRGTILSSVRDEAVGRIVNIASGRETTIRRIAEMILEVTGSKSRIVLAPRRSWDGIVRRVAKTNVAKNLLGYETRIDVMSGLVKYFDWIKRQDLGKCEW